MANDFSKITIDGTTYNVKVPNKLTVGSKTFDGSSAVTITASDLGLSNALHFIGETTTALSDGSTTSSISVGGKTHTATTGDVVLYESKEFVWQGSVWKELGDGSSHALKTISISAGGGLTGGGTLEANRTISHADTSSQASVSASGRRYITGVTLDGYGHVTGLTTGTETVTAPTVNNGTLTIQKNGTSVGEFTANQSGNTTANITVPTTASDVNALSLDGGTIKKSKTIKMDASANSDGANLKWGTVNSKNPYIGYASDQTDGTFVIGSLLGTNYASGLAIGGGSGNLLWKGKKVATTSDIPDVSGKANLSGGNTFTGQQIFQNTNSGAVAECVVNNTAWDSFTVRSVSDNTQKTAISNGYVWCQDSDTLYSRFNATGIYYGNDTSGYEGTLKFPTNISGEKTIATTSDIPTMTFSNGVLTITT